MKTYICIGLAALLTACGPSSNETTTTQTTTTKTTTTGPGTAPADPVPPVAPVSPLTQANLDRVHTDMSPAEVQAIFGPPTSSDSKPIPIVGGTETTYSYSNGSSAVTIIFKNNLVKEKSGTFGP